MLERKVYNNDDITFFSVYQRFAKPSCNNVLQPSPLHGSDCNTLSFLGLSKVNTQKRMFYMYPFNKSCKSVKTSIVYQNSVHIT